MEHGLKVAEPLNKPLMIFDGDCGFCRFWIKKMTVPGVDYTPFQNPSVHERFPEIPPSEFDKSIQLIVPGGNVFSGAEAILRSLATDPKKRWPLWVYRTVPGVAFLTEWGYAKVSKHRSLFSALIRTNC